MSYFSNAGSTQSKDFDGTFIVNQFCGLGAVKFTTNDTTDIFQLSIENGFSFIRDIPIPVPFFYENISDVAILTPYKNDRIFTVKFPNNIPINTIVYINLVLQNR